MAKRESVTQRKAPKRSKRTDWKKQYCEAAVEVIELGIKISALTAERDIANSQAKALTVALEACDASVACERCKAKDEEIALLKANAGYKPPAYTQGNWTAPNHEVKDISSWWKFWRRRAAERRDA